MASATSTERLIAYRELPDRWARPAAAGIAPGSAPRNAPGNAPGGPPPVPLHVRGVGEILDLALDVFVQRFWFCAGGSAFLWLLANGFAGPHPGEATLSGGLAAALCVQYLTTAVVVVAVYGELQGQRVSGRAAILLALQRFPALFVLALLPLGGVLLVLLPMRGCALVLWPFLLFALMLSTWLLALAPAAVVLEKIGPWSAVRRSAHLALGAFRPWLALTVLETWLVGPLAALPQALDDARWRGAIETAFPLPAQVGDTFWLVLRSLGEGISTAFGAVVLVVFYLDRRVRLEGFDLAMRLERLQVRAARSRKRVA